MRKSTWSF